MDLGWLTVGHSSFTNDAAKGGNAVYAFTRYGHGGAHGHYDKNHFILYSAGKILMPDAGTHARADRPRVSRSCRVGKEKPRPATRPKCSKKALVARKRS